MKYLTRVKISQVRKGMSVIKLFLSEQSDKKKEWKNVCVEFNCKNVQFCTLDNKRRRNRNVCAHLKQLRLCAGVMCNPLTREFFSFFRISLVLMEIRDSC